MYLSEPYLHRIEAPCVIKLYADNPLLYSSFSKLRRDGLLCGGSFRGPLSALRRRINKNKKEKTYSNLNVRSSRRPDFFFSFPLALFLLVEFSRCNPLPFSSLPFQPHNSTIQSGVPEFRPHPSRDLLRNKLRTTTTATATRLFSFFFVVLYASFDSFLLLVLFFLSLLRTTRSKRNESASTTSNKRKRDGAIRPWSLTTAAPLSLQRKRVKAHRGRFFRSHLRGASTIVTRAPLCRNVPWGGLRAGRAQDQVRRAFIHRQRLLAETAISVAACPLGLAIIQSNSRTVMPCRQEWRNV